MNILVSEPIGPSRFDVTFKLADLGLKTFEAELEKDAVNDGQRTDMYSEFCNFLLTEFTSDKK